MYKRREMEREGRRDKTVRKGAPWEATKEKTL